MRAEASPAKMARPVPQSPAKRDLTEGNQSRKSPAKAFAGLDSLVDEDDLAADFFAFAGLDSKEWRIERRYRMRSDGQKIMYWNYRKRKVEKGKKGKRRIEYRKGGSMVI